MGKKLKNPYSVKNMKIALNNLKAKIGNTNSKDGEGFSVESTHLYIKFSPQTLAEEKMLEEDSTIIVSDYPLDYDYSIDELEEMGYDNPNVIGNYYTAVPKDHPLPNVPMTVLEELYIPEEDPYFEEVGNGEADVVANQLEIINKNDLYANLIVEAYTLTENEKDLDVVSSPDGKFWIFGSKWYPSGRITMYDTSLGREVPVDGAQVLMRQWFTVRQGITDDNGNFSTGFVRGKAKYVLQWERHHYDIRNGKFGQAETHGPNVKKQAWYYSVNGEQNIQFAMIHRAAYHYYYKDIKGLRRPPMFGDLPTRMKMAAMNKTNGSTVGDFSFWRSLGGILPTVRIYKRTSMSDYYATTLHELGHASHWKMGWWTFTGVQENVAESWARGVQWELSRMVYPNYSVGYSGNYTGIVQDLIDNDNSAADQTAGYSISQIENSLKYQKTWQNWRDKIKRDHENPTKNHLDAIFNFWFNQQQ